MIDMPAHRRDHRRPARPGRRVAAADPAAVERTIA